MSVLTSVRKMFSGNEKLIDDMEARQVERHDAYQSLVTAERLPEAAAVERVLAAAGRSLADLGRERAAYRRYLTLPGLVATQAAAQVDADAAGEAMARARQRVAAAEREFRDATAAMQQAAGAMSAANHKADRARRAVLAVEHDVELSPWTGYTPPAKVPQQLPTFTPPKMREEADPLPPRRGATVGVA